MSDFKKNLEEFKNTISTLSQKEKLINLIAQKLVKFCKNRSSKILVCGNGGSATDADHFVTELVIRFKKNRKALPALSLSSNPGLITACANDYSFKFIFKRQLEALANKNDCIIFISTSGNSENIIEAAKYAKKNKIYSIALSGKKGGKLSNLCNQSFIVESDSVARIQEVHIFLLHYFCEVIDNNF